MKFEIILHSLVGSRAYGLATETSDYDYKSVAIPELSNYFGLNKWSGTTIKNPNENTEHTIYELIKFIDQCINASPESLDILFSPNAKHTHSFGMLLLSIKDEFISKKCKYSYTGFAHAQLKKIRTNPEHQSAGKYAAQAVRLMNMAEEILRTYRINVDRTNIDKDQLMDWKLCWEPNRLKYLEAYIKNKEDICTSLYETSALTYSPNKEKIDNFITNNLRAYFDTNR